MNKQAQMPEGIVAFLFTDIEGSTRLWEQFPEAMGNALQRHNAILRDAITAHHGYLFKIIGDACCAAFHKTADALAAALDAQYTLLRENWEEVGALRVRMAIHTGSAELREGDYFGSSLSRVARILSAAHGGQILISQPAVETLKGMLPAGVHLKDMGQHRLRDLAQPEHLFQVRAEGLPDQFPPLRSLMAFAHNLPTLLTSFVGRERELALVKQLLQRARLLTLTGGGGIGKTRIARQAVLEVLPEFADGVWWVDIGALGNPARLAETVCEVLGVSIAGSASARDALCRELASKQLLLLMDNCEHLRDACAELVGRVLAECPSVQVLATSREVLGVPGEQLLPIPPLSLPPLQPLPPVETLLEWDAVRLFVERAQLTQPAFTLTAQNARAVVELCHQLDGIPLALELAAARVRVLTVDQLVARLSDRFQLLQGQTDTSRHHTLQEAIDWSYHQLSEQEQRLLDRLSVFEGGWSLSAAEEVCADEQLAEWEVIDLLTHLVEKSLVSLCEGGEGEAHYSFSQTILQYARARLEERGETRQIQERHAEWCLALALEAESHMTVGHQVSEWMERIEAEQSNLRAALRRCIEADDARRGLPLANALVRFWYFRGYWHEGVEWLEAILSLSSAQVRTAERATALWALSGLYAMRGDPAKRRAFAEESLAIWHELGNKLGVGDTLNVLGSIAVTQGENALACEYYQQALALFREMDNWRGEALLLSNLAIPTARRGHYANARAYAEQALEIYQSHEARQNESSALMPLIEIVLTQGEYSYARALIEYALELSREIGSRRFEIIAFGYLCDLERALGNLSQARASFEHYLSAAREGQDLSQLAIAHLVLADLAFLEGALDEAHNHAMQALEQAHASSYPAVIASALCLLTRLYCQQGEPHNARTCLQEACRALASSDNTLSWVALLEAQAEVEATEGQHERALLCWSRATALRQQMGTPRRPCDLPHYEASLSTLRTALGETRFEQLYQQAQTNPIEQELLTDAGNE